MATSPNSASVPRKTINALTSIRGVAALCVVLHHLVLFFRFNKWSSPHTLTSMFYMGFTGVDLFFVLSGFILTIVHVQMRPRELGTFAMRRVLRLYPLHLSILAVMAGLGWFSIIWPRHTLNWSLLPLAGTLLAPYFSLTHNPWNDVSWSAGVELSCYLAFPLGLFALRRAPSWVLAGITAALAYTAWTLHLHDAEAWTGLPALQRGWSDFALGAAAGLLSTRLSLNRSSACLLETAGLGLIGWAVYAMQPPLIPLGAVMLIFALKAQKGPINRLLNLRPLVYLGEISYSIYLLQMVVFMAFFSLWRVPNYPTPVLYPAITPLFLVQQAAFIAALIATASLTYKYIELPGQRLWRTAARLPARAVTAS